MVGDGVNAVRVRTEGPLVHQGSSSDAMSSQNATAGGWCGASDVQQRSDLRSQTQPHTPCSPVPVPTSLRSFPPATHICPFLRPSGSTVSHCALNADRSPKLRPVTPVCGKVQLCLPSQPWSPKRKTPPAPVSSHALNELSCLPACFHNFSPILGATPIPPTRHFRNTNLTHHTRQTRTKPPFSAAYSSPVPAQHSFTCLVPS